MVLSHEEDLLADSFVNTTGSNCEIALTAFNVNLLLKDIRTLKPKTWLNDEIINIWMEILQTKAIANGTRTKFFHSFLFNKLLPPDHGIYKYSEVHRWISAETLTDFDTFVVPIHVCKSHWTAAVINKLEKTIEYFDSMGASGVKFMKPLLQFFADAYADKLSVTLDLEEWNLVSHLKGSPQQIGGYDCGVFMCAVLEAVGLKKRDKLYPT